MRRSPVKVETKLNFNTSYWKLKKSRDFGEYEKVDTVKFTLNLDGREKKKFNYILTTHHGRRADR